MKISLLVEEEAEASSFTTRIRPSREKTKRSNFRVRGESECALLYSF
jgi:hypothetical protein